VYLVQLGVTYAVDPCDSRHVNAFSSCECMLYAESWCVDVSSTTIKAENYIIVLSLINPFRPVIMSVPKRKSEKRSLGCKCQCEVTGKRRTLSWCMWILITIIDLYNVHTGRSTGVPDVLKSWFLFPSIQDAWWDSSAWPLNSLTTWRPYLLANDLEPQRLDHCGREKPLRGECSAILVTSVAS
jgi:hypothetical protein